jgi:hypothetical protein
MRTQAQAAATQAAASLANAQAAATSAGEAQRANRENAERFRNEQAAMIGVNVVASNYGTPAAITYITLQNTGRTEAKTLMLRAGVYFYVAPIGKTLRDLENPSAAQISDAEVKETIKRALRDAEDSAKDPRLPREDRMRAQAHLKELQDLLQTTEEGRAVQSLFDAWQQPDLPFDEQAPILPPEPAFDRLAKVSEKQRQGFQLRWEHLQRHKQQTGMESQPSPFEHKIAPGLRSIAIGDLSPNTSIPYPVDRALDANGTATAKAGGSAFYIALRFSYTDHWGREQTSADFCFQYVALLNTFALCQRETQEGNRHDH